MSNHDIFEEFRKNLKELKVPVIPGDMSTHDMRVYTRACEQYEEEVRRLVDKMRMKQKSNASRSPSLCESCLLLSEESDGKRIIWRCPAIDNGMIDFYGVCVATCSSYNHKPPIVIKKSPIKVFISGPMTGVNNYLKVFNDAEKKLKDCGFDVINPCLLPQDSDWEDAILIDLMLVRCSDILVQLPGWESSDGANIEFFFARHTKKQIFKLDTLLREFR